MSKYKLMPRKPSVSAESGRVSPIEDFKYEMKGSYHI